MKKMWIFIFLLVVLFLLIMVLMSFMAVNPVMEEEQEEQKKQETQNKDAQYPFIIDLNIHNTGLLAEFFEYKTCPPFRPERFRRKVKMLWGIDIKDYPEDALIQFGTANSLFKMSIKYQIMIDWDLPGDEYPFWIPIHQDTIFLPFRKYLFYHDEQAFNEIEKLSINSYEDTVGKIDHENIDANVMGIADISQMIYHSVVFQPPPLLIEYINNHRHYVNAGLCGLAYAYHKDPKDNMDMNFYRTSDIRLDMISLYFHKELSKGKIFVSDWFNEDKNGIFLGFPINRMENATGVGFLSSSILEYIACYFESVKYLPWPNYKRERGVASFMAFLLQIQHKIQNKYIIQFMSGQIDDKTLGDSEGMSSFRDSIRSNNYYGYAVLREFCENPEREMPTLEKVGTSFKGIINNVNTSLLYLEPFSNSYDIDTIRPNETFIAYEMGHDDYYFVEVVKPVESPIAGPDGYAMILDRTETVYGYMKKSEVREYTDTDTLSQTVTTGKSKQGIINDPDGYVNIRKEMNAQSEILGKIVKNEIFDYWETAGSNWYAVKTQDGILGFVHKDRIREKLNTGGWVILDDD